MHIGKLKEYNPNINSITLGEKVTNNLYVVLFFSNGMYYFC